MWLLEVVVCSLLQVALLPLAAPYVPHCTTVIIFRRARQGIVSKTATQCLCSVYEFRDKLVNGMRAKLRRLNVSVALVELANAPKFGPTWFRQPVNFMHRLVCNVHMRLAH